MNHLSYMRIRSEFQNRLSTSFTVKIIINKNEFKSRKADFFHHQISSSCLCHINKGLFVTILNYLSIDIYSFTIKRFKIHTETEPRVFDTYI